MRCPNCQTLNPINAKFCLECGNRLVVCPNCGTINLPVAKFCIECGTALQLRGDTDASLAAVSNSSTPRTTHIPLTPEVLLPPEERRIVTVMFADIIGSTPMAARMDPEDMRAILMGYFNLMTQQIRKHGGTVEKYIGDAVMAVFGVPITHEDDPDRAIRAALDMQTALTTFNEQRQAFDGDAIRLQMRIGINTGEVAAPSNEQQRQDFLITGDAVNVAARLQQVAAPDTILVGERTYLATREVFDFRPLEPMQLKGKSEPLTAFVVQGLPGPTQTNAQHPRGVDGLQVPLVGRSLELTLLHTNYARVTAERSPFLITILGVPGIGKSRLVREFVQREQEDAKNKDPHDAVPRVLQGRCPPYGDSITFWPLIEILRSLLQVQADESNEALQLRFTEFVNGTLTAAKRTESSEEIATTILRSIGRGLSANIDGQSTREHPKREYQRSTYAVRTKQPTTQAPLLRAWRVLLEALAQMQPLIIVVDDLQWADEALLDLLEYLTDRITTVPILFLCPARPDFFDRRRDWGGGQRNFTTIELDALSREESSELVDTILNTNDLPEIIRYTILTRAEGNPFFVEEIIRMFIDQGLLVREVEGNGATCWRLSHQNETLVSERTTLAEPPDDALLNMHYVLPLPRVPDTVQGVLAARVDLLHPLEKLILQHAAIIGRTFWLSLLLELAYNLSAATALNALDSLIQRDFIIEDVDAQVRSPIEDDRVFSFKHILIRDVVYNNIPRVRRSQEHARLAFWLEEHTINNQGAFIELLAYHYQQALITWSSAVTAVDVNSVQEALAGKEVTTVQLTRAELRHRAIKYLTLAGDQALNSYYTLRALQAYNDAFELLLDDHSNTATLVAMHEKLGDAYSQRGTMDEAWQAYRKALRLATGDDVSPDSVDLLYLYERLADIATRWLGGFDTPPDAWEARTYIDAGLRLLDGKALNTERVAFLTYQAFWYIRQLEATTYAQKAEMAEQALASGHEALRLAEQLNNPSALSLAFDALGFIYTEYHRYNDAHQIQHRRQQLEERLTDREELYDLYISLGKIHAEVADYATALMWFGRAWNNAQTMESPSLLLTSMAWRMWTWLQWDRWQEAHQVAQDILHLSEQYQQDEKRQLWALETLAMLEYRQGNQEQGEYYARQYKRLIDRQAERANSTTEIFLSPSTKMRDIYLAREDWTNATIEYKEKLKESEPLPSPEVLTTLAELMVTTNEDAQAQEEMCTRALTLAEESGACKSLALAFRARGRMYIEQQKWSLAKDDLGQALQRCEALDIPWERGLTLYYIGMLYKRRATTFDKDTPNRRSTDLERARYHFEQALGFFESMHAEPSMERVKQAMGQEGKVHV